MATAAKQLKKDFEENRVAVSEELRNVKEASTQTDTKVEGHGPRLSKVNLFTLLSLWMELFPKEESQRDHENEPTRVTGLVVVSGRRVLGLHCSSQELHAGQVAVIKHGPRLAGCDLYFSRKPCSSCLKMAINAGVNRISYWPGDAEISLAGADGGVRAAGSGLQDAELDAVAGEKLKSNSRPHICVLLQPLAGSMLQFVEETSAGCDFLEKMAADEPARDARELFRRRRQRNLDQFSRPFLVPDARRHRELLARMGLEHFCVEPYFSSLRQHMKDLIRLLALVASGVPGLHEGYGFHQKDPPPPGVGPSQTLSQEVVRHCIIQARLLEYRTDDPKVGVGAVIWAEGKSGHCDGTGRMYLVGCGYNAYPAGSEYAEYPQMDDKQEDRQCRKYRYIIHAEQNALTFRSAEIKEEENTMLFVTKCPCDECVPLIRGAGIKQIYTTDLDSGKNKHDISYLRFDGLQGVQKFTWQKKKSLARCASEQACLPKANGCMKHRREDEPDVRRNKNLRS